MKQKRRKRHQKKRWIGKGLFLLFLIGIIAFMAFLFKREIIHTLGPFLDQWNILGEKKEIVLYFSDREGEYLIGEKRGISKRDKVNEEAKETIIELIKGPKEKLTPTLPSRTKILTFQLDERGVAKVNFTRDLSKDHPGGSSAEIMTTYSIVNSLTLNFPQIKRVQILIEGRAIETIAGHLSLKQPLSSNPDLVRRQ